MSSRGEEREEREEEVVVSRGMWEPGNFTKDGERHILSVYRVYWDCAGSMGVWAGVSVGARVWLCGSTCNSDKRYSTEVRHKLHRGRLRQSRRYTQDQRKVGY